MSRGLGRVQQAVVSALQDEEPQRLRQLAARVYGEEPPSRAAYVATTRAVRSLTRRGWVDTQGRRPLAVTLTRSARLALYMTTHTA